MDFCCTVKQIDGVAMGSSLGPLIANKFMVGLGGILVSNLNDHAKKWRRFMDDTFDYIKRDSIEYVLFVLNSFHDNIKFTCDCLFSMLYLLGIMRK